MEQQEKKEIRLELPEKVRQIIEQIQKHGFEAYAVGGCVRDSLLGRTPDDWDITTSAKPQEVKAIFPRTIDTGIEHGTVTVMMGKEGFEVTTYRIDGAYLDGRHPESVEFSSNLVEDLKRRDFTINAMAYNEQQGLVDVFEGIEDMQRKVIRCVGNPKERFGEDALRMMRAIRFSAQLGFEIEEETYRAVEELASELVDFINRSYPGVLEEKYAIEHSDDKFEVLEKIAQSRHCLVRGNEFDTEKAAAILLDDFRNGRLGRITLEVPEAV